jgi:hypothetical protein
MYFMDGNKIVAFLEVYGSIILPRDLQEYKGGENFSWADGLNPPLVMCFMCSPWRKCFVVFLKLWHIFSQLIYDGNMENITVEFMNKSS